MKRFLTPIAAAFVLTGATLATAAPYCAALTAADQLPKKYQKRGGFFSDAATGWIVGQDELRDKYSVSDEAVTLWHSIKAEFDKHGVELVVMSPPPRPLFAPQAAQDAMGLGDFANLADLQTGFSTYIAALNGAGITAPDLSAITQSPAADGYYFARDTHWTPMGAALSVAHLGAAMGGASVKDTMAKIDATDSYSEKGSLAGVIKDVCGARPDPESVPAAQYAQDGSAASLLGDAPALEKMALVGTSFSDRYKSDAYQVAGALGFVLGASVDNFSVTGGGLVGSMEAFVRSGALMAGGYKTVVWETPYSAPLTHVDGLRQILGVLYATGARTAADTLEAKIGKDWISISHDMAIGDLRGIEIETKNSDTGQLVLELIDADGEKTRTKMIKTDRVTADLRSTQWAMAIDDMAQAQIVRIKLRMPKATGQEPAIIRFFN